jgi:hypothetical protein
LPRRELFALNIFRVGDITGRHFSQRYFRFVITDILGRGTHSWRPMLTFGGRTRQIRWRGAKPCHKKKPERASKPNLAPAIGKVPNGERWAHEIKFDGYRVQVHLRDAAVKVFTRRGNDWTNRFRKIALMPGT